MAIITISRGTFSGGKMLAESMAAKLGYTCLSRQVLVDAARKYGVSLEKISDALEEPPGFIERLSRERVHYLAYIRAALISSVRNNNIVYHGLAGHLLLAGICNILKVRVIANMDFRLKGAMERHQFKRKEDAIEYVKKADERRAKWAKFLYHVELSDPSLYDIVINLNCVSLESASEILSHAAEMNEFKNTPETKKMMNDLVLSAEVRAIIASNAESKGIDDLGVEIGAEEGIITLGGTVGTLEDADKIREVVRAIPGVTGINSKMQLRHYW